MVGRVTTAVVVIAAVVTACGALGSSYRGTIEEVLDPDAAPERVGLGVRLDGREIAGADRIDLYLDADELSCMDGSPLDVDDVEAGGEVVFTRTGDGVDTSSPPGVSGTDVRVGCG